MWPAWRWWCGRAVRAGHGTVKDMSEARGRKSDVLEALRDIEKERDRYKADITANEKVRGRGKARGPE